MKRKIPAFTILEVTVVMVLAAISITIIYAAFAIINKWYLGFDTRNKHLSELVLADKLLKKDFSEARLIMRSQNGLLLKSDSSLIAYEFNEDNIVRRQNDIRSDTLHLVNESLSYSFEQADITGDKPVDRLGFTAIVEEEKINLVYTKLYSAEDLVQRNRDLRSF